MNPAFSVLIFTTLSGAGLGLWAWLGLRIALVEAVAPGAITTCDGEIWAASQARCSGCASGCSSVND